MRDLTINLGTQREFNHLRVSNLKEFLDKYLNRFEYYQSPYSILADLERKVLFENNPEDLLLISYKPGGYIIFRARGIMTSEKTSRRRFVTYTYEGIVS
jgi:hypothetical protein